VHISEKGLDYKKAVARAWREGKFEGPIRVSGAFTAPDRRRRDLDNVFGKALFDSLKGLAYDDDDQVWAYGATGWTIDTQGRKAVVKGGRLWLTIEPL